METLSGCKRFIVCIFSQSKPRGLKLFKFCCFAVFFFFLFFFCFVVFFFQFHLIIITIQVTVLHM